MGAKRSLTGIIVGLGTLAGAAAPICASAAPPRSAPRPSTSHRRAVKPQAKPVKLALPQPVRLEIAPSAVSLVSARARQRLVVYAHFADGTIEDVTDTVRLVSTAPRVARITESRSLAPGMNGVASLKASLGKLVTQVPVRVEGSHLSEPPSFVKDIVPVLSQAGCNALACHGSPVGKAGFKLSMFGFEPELDHPVLIKQPRTAPETGVRVDLSNPEASLILQKATMSVPHQGGLRFKKDSEEYRLILEWLRAGAPFSADEDLVRVTAVTVAPKERVFQRSGLKQRLLVTATYSDGSTEDVTHKSVFVTNDDGVASVDTAGVCASTGVGDTAVFARYLGVVGVARCLAPQPEPAPAKEYAGFVPNNALDRHTLARWQRLRFVPAGNTTDSEFLRRVSLDLTGTPPPPEKVREFLADNRPDKRSRKIDELLSSADYADWWAVFWGDNLRNNSRLLLADGAKAYRAWIREAVEKDKPYNEFVRELVVASGDTTQVGAANFFRIARTPPDIAEQTAQLFMGIRLQCANCHNHPFEKWTRMSYHQFAAFFARINVRNNPKGSMVAVNPKGEYRFPDTRNDLSPTPLGEQPLSIAGDQDRREALASWLTAPQNAFFARNLVNRLWAQLFGRGIIEPADDVRVTNPASNEPLLDELAGEFVKSGYSVKHVLRLIANSRTYQLSSLAGPRNSRDNQNFSRSYQRRIKAEALLDAVSLATGIPEAFNGHPAGTRAIQLVDNRVNSYFMDIFGRPRREVVCTCEREETANLTQALHLINGQTLQSKLGSPKGRIAELEKSGKADGEVVEELYLWTLCRRPEPDEAARGLKLMSESKNRRQALEDLGWVLMNSREFLFNH